MSQSKATKSSELAPPSRSELRALALDLARIARLVLTGYACVATMGAPRPIIYPDCLNCLNEPYLDLYLRAPCALAVLIVLAGVAAFRIPGAAKITRCAALVSVAIWVVSIGLARGWW